MIGLEKIALQAASMGLASIFSRVVWEGGGKLLGWMGKKSLDEKTKQAIAEASVQYIQNYGERHGILKVLGMREPAPLESVYTTVQLLDKWDLRRFESIETLEKAYRQTRSRSFQPRESSRQDGLRVANEKQYLMVLGGPGAGKSTFLRKLGLEALKGTQGGYEHECIPVLIELKSFTSSKINIEKAIAQEFKICGFPHSEEATTQLLEQGKLLILLDGLDEVPGRNLNEAICQIQNFVDQYDQNRFIASCRLAAYRHNFRRFTDVAMADFDASQIKQFIHNWFRSDADQQAGTGQKCWELLLKPENAAAKELAHSPLLLTLLCLVYDRSQNFPNNRSVLYRKALRVLLEEWASEKRILRDEIYQGLSTELEEILLSEIAYSAFKSDRLFFSQGEIVSQIKTFLTDNLNAPKHLNGEAVLDAIAIQQGILVERAEDVFSFSHLTLQEYLTAQYIADNHQVARLVADHLTDPRWQEVFLLVAGLMRHGADELLVRMARKTRRYITTPKLQALLQWAHQITEGPGTTVKPVVKRASALFLALARDRALDLVRVLHPNTARVLDLVRTLDLVCAPAPVQAIDLARAMELARNLELDCVPARARARTRSLNRIPARTLARAVTNSLAQEFSKSQLFNSVNFHPLIARLDALKTKAPDTSQPYEVQQAFRDRLSQVWLHALKLDAALVDLSAAEVQALEHYLYANCLLVRCKQAAVRVSAKTWEEIETQMLFVAGC
ncbi:NACHT domain-containing NTPase [Trichocoleus sp. FACHB-262]|uniref:NACHT domain-containing protein n=1 Tax=Trichocoleus sp. FACHB-262 TaxID=2692869 RepID=UPI001683C1D7|nr:NACHT domain-containing protein [Trichocoleus sp. FACHB-262]MBD2119664.1 NACHT domain-containing protein [Trichocoleus sp. FACHB-262]